jgi:hypothetical protein
MEGLVETVGKLMDHFGKAEKRKVDEAKQHTDEEASEPKAADIKKAIDDLATQVGDKLDEFDAQLTKLADGESAQQGSDIKKATPKDPLAGILD